MPNHVSINLSIGGTHSELTAFMDTHLIETDTLAPDGAMHFDFNTIVPMPKALEDTTSPTSKGDAFDEERKQELCKQYGFDNWYDWSIHNWGTKWGAYNYDGFNITMAESAEPDSDQSIEFSFQTAWALPTPIFDKLAEMYPNLVFHIECCEEGGFFAGEADIINGRVIDKIVYDNSEHWQLWASNIYGYEFDQDGEVC